LFLERQQGGIREITAPAISQDAAGSASPLIILPLKRKDTLFNSKEKILCFVEMNPAAMILCFGQVCPQNA
jgi:hypothetical protein